MDNDELGRRLAALEAEVMAQRFAIHAVIEEFRRIPDLQQHERIHYNANVNLAVALQGTPIFSAAHEALKVIFLPEIPSREHQAPPA